MNFSEKRNDSGQFHKMESSLQVRVTVWKNRARVLTHEHARQRLLGPASEFVGQCPPVCLSGTFLVVTVLLGLDQVWESLTRLSWSRVCGSQEMGHSWRGTDPSIHNHGFGDHVAPLGSVRESACSLWCLESGSLRTEFIGQLGNRIYLPK